MNDTPRVTVPSSPYSAAFGAIHHEDTPNFLFTVHPADCADEVARALNTAHALSAAPAPEGWAWNPHQITPNDIAAILDENADCSDEGGGLLNASQLAEKIWRAGLSALATREEAPAEVGEIAQILTGYRNLGPHSDRDAAIAHLCDLLERAQPPAREEEGGTLDPAFIAWLKERDCLPNDDDGTIEWADIVCALNDWEADLTQPREDAQPVAWRYKLDDETAQALFRPGWNFQEHKPPVQWGPYGRLITEAEPLYTHPAPDALRVVTPELAAEFANIDGPWTRGQMEMEEVWSRLIDAQLAALQAEQGAK